MYGQSDGGGRLSGGAYAAGDYGGIAGSFLAEERKPSAIRREWKMKKNAEFPGGFIKNNRYRAEGGRKVMGRGYRARLGLEAILRKRTMKVSTEQEISLRPFRSGCILWYPDARKSVSVHEGAGAIELPAVEINDSPRFSYRGMMPDVVPR